MNDYWKTTAITLAGILVTIVSAWFAFGRNTVSAAEVTEMIQEQAPYTEDRGAVTTILDRLVNDVGDLSTRVRNIETGVVRIEERLDGLIR